MSCPQPVTHYVHLPLFPAQSPLDDISFTIVLELNDDSQPSASEGSVSKLEFKSLSRIIINAIQGPATMGPRSEEPHYFRDFRQRRNASRQGSKYRDNRRKFLSGEASHKTLLKPLPQIALVVQESEVKLRLSEQEQATARAKQREVEKGKARML